jgi:hypothetical protein
MPNTVSSLVGNIMINTMRIMAYGTDNLWAGIGAGNYTLTGIQNVGIGSSCMGVATTAAQNTNVGAYGMGALTIGGNNTSVGAFALSLLTSGSNNTAIGYLAGGSTITGQYNTFIGTQTGGALSGAESSNIYIGNYQVGVSGESNTLRIGAGTGTGSGQISRAYINGINGVVIGSGTAVVIDSSGKLGTVVSSIKYKENVKDMADASESIYQLRPVNFNYKDDKDKNKQWGLIAEEVEKAFPDLVLYDTSKGTKEISSVKYLDLISMMLNEIIKLKKRVDKLQKDAVK